MRLFLTTYQKSGTHQIMPALGIEEQIVDRSNHPMTYVSKYVGTAPKINKDGVKKTVNALQKMPGKAFGHVSFLPEYLKVLNEQPTKIIFNIRDPRDVIVSEYHNMLSGKSEWLNFWLPEKQCKVLDDDPISHLIDFATRWEAWTGWMFHTSVYVVRYEDLRMNGANTCLELAEWLLPYEIDPKAVAENLLPKKLNPTFRKGGIGDWNWEFSDEHKKKTEKVLGHIIDKLGYKV